MRPQELAERALEAAGGLDAAVAIVTESSRADLRWARTTVTTNGESRQTNVVLVGFAGTTGGVATATLTRSQPSSDDIHDLAEALMHSLRQAPPADDSYAMVQPTSSESPRWSEPAQRTSSEALAPLADPLGATFRSCDASGIELFGYAEHECSSTWLASSTGVRLRHDQPAARLEVTAKSHGRTRSAWWGLADDDFTRVDLAPGERALRQGLDWQATRVSVHPGRHRAVLTPGAIGDLMVDLWWSASAREAVEGRSVFSAPGRHDGNAGLGATTRIGERLSSRRLTLSSDPRDAVIPAAPFLAAAASSDAASVFDNGIPLDRVDWIRDGVLAHLHAPRWIARAHNLPVAISADSLRLTDEMGTGDLEDLIARTDNGLVVTCLWYNRVVDPQTLLLTGLTRDGVYVVKGGEVVGATTNFRFNDSPVGVLDRMVDSGVTQRTLPREMGDYAPRVAMPPVAIEDFHFSTVSDAL